MMAPTVRPISKGMIESIPLCFAVRIKIINTKAKVPNPSAIQALKWLT